MELQKYCDCIKENKRLTDFMVDLACEGRLKDVPGSLGKFYSQKKFDIYPPIKNSIEDMQPIVNIKRCGRKISGNWSWLGNNFKTNGSFRCDSPYCSVCNSYRSYQSISHIRFLFEHEYNINDYKFFFITFTLPNEIGGFRETYDILLKSVKNCIKYIGSDVDHKGVSFCEGVYGSFEIKHNVIRGKDTGWHPHFHMIIAYKASDVLKLQLDRKGKVKYLEVKKKSKNTFKTSSIELKEAFYNYLVSHFPSYCQVKEEYYHSIGSSFFNCLQIDFSPIGNSIDSFNEVCKYVCKTSEILNKEDLYIFIRDSFRLTRNIKRGIFKWTAEINKKYVEYRIQRDIHNFYFVYFGTSLVLSPKERSYYLQKCKNKGIENAEQLLNEGYLHKSFVLTGINLKYVDGRFELDNISGMQEIPEVIQRYFMRC